MRRLEAENAALRRSVGGPNAYECRVNDVKELDDKGILVEAAAGFRAQAVGAIFVVNRETGMIAGGVGNNETFESRNVIFSPPDNPFYVISTTNPPNRNVVYLSIRDWVAGSEKPFVLADAGNVFTGMCQK